MKWFDKLTNDDVKDCELTIICTVTDYSIKFNNNTYDYDVYILLENMIIINNKNNNVYYCNYRWINSRILRLRKELRIGDRIKFKLKRNCMFPNIIYINKIVVIIGRVKWKYRSKSGITFSDFLKNNITIDLDKYSISKIKYYNEYIRKMEENDNV